MQFEISPDALANKIILITGSGDGIGKQLALDCAKAGATTILLGKTVEKLEQVYDQICQNNWPQPAIVPMDLNGANESHYQGLATTIEEQFGKLDGLVLNAGQLGTLRPLAQIPLDEWSEVMQVNVTSQFLMLKTLIPVLQKAQHASVVFASSGVGRKGRAYWGCYSVSKFASDGLMQSLADEYANSSLRFNAVNPGATHTAMRTKAYPAENISSLKKPEDVVAPYLYLLSDSSIGQNGLFVEAQPK
ncbi:YciK family oxidoreductase [Neptunicella marina]|uniref:YciK family oxidoreductase n=1 Tax=Neptunicella marina TaxID=2125989 RepID=A0A8J6ILA0_9ALTE|nr:YciK family oxidoreductase [Neptunicella marina]MBC3764665.1 YciK family oxidoreductase [Neptunicella marina]